MRCRRAGPDAILERLADPGQRDSLRDHLESRLFAPLEPVTFSCLPRNSHLEGKSLAEAARQRGDSPAQTLCDLLLEEELKVGYVNAPPAIPALREAIDRDCLQLLARPDAMACSDITPLGSAPHPRCYGAFPRFLGRLRRRHRTLSLETMVQRMTDGPARRFGMTGRGRLQPGYFADLVVFDPDTVTDTATYEDPRQFPEGIPWVVVNGQIAVGRGAMHRGPGRPGSPVSPWQNSSGSGTDCREGRAPPRARASRPHSCRGAGPVPAGG